MMRNLVALYQLSHHCGSRKIRSAQFGFGNGQNGLYALKGNAALNGTALSEANFGGLLLPGPNKPRSVDLWPIFHTGVPNLAPYQLATGKGGNPLAVGKPFINNFLPNGGDMLTPEYGRSRHIKNIC